jgi:hypothetical protein
MGNAAGWSQSQGGRGFLMKRFVGIRCGIYLEEYQARNF